MDADMHAAIDAYAQQIADATPDPSPALAAWLRALFNPPGRLERLQANARGHHVDEPPEPPRRNRGRHRNP